MAITVTSSSVSIKGNEYVVRGQFSLDASYPAGGYPVTGATIGLSTINIMSVEPTAGYTFDYNATTGRLLAYYATPSGTLSITATNANANFYIGLSADRSGLPLALTGGTAVTGITGFSGTSAALAAVATGTSLAAVTGVDFLAWGT